MQQLYFGEFSAELDESRCLGLFRGYEPVGLSSLPRRVLFVLLAHRPRPVSAKTLLNELWHPGANLSNVAKQVRTLRVAMDDERSPGAYVRTIGKEGYAFVMPVTDSPARTSPPAAAGRPSLPVIRRTTDVSAGDAGARVARAPGRRAWGLARRKLAYDFRGSCLHDIELLHEAIEECSDRMRHIASVRRVPRHERSSHEPTLAPPSQSANGRWGEPEPDARTASLAAELIRHSRRSPVAVNVGSYAPACVAVLRSLHRRYGLEVRTNSRDLSGRQQILRLAYDDATDFLLAPHAPVLFVGDHRALDYRWMSPVHAYEQIVLRAPGAARGRRQKILVYKGGSPEEQLLARVGIPSAAEPEMIGSLEQLLAAVAALDAGDMVIAWQPLAAGLESRYGFARLAEFKCWLSLYCHKRWERGAMRSLRDQFWQLFLSEWVYCREHPAWAVECLAVELSALESFAASSGLAAKLQRSDGPVEHRRP
jgi:DNA-binding winged helix-turn-helix (wHTH) protein